MADVGDKDIAPERDGRAVEGNRVSGRIGQGDQTRHRHILRKRQAKVNDPVRIVNRRRWLTFGDGQAAFRIAERLAHAAIAEQGCYAHDPEVIPHIY